MRSSTMTMLSSSTSVLLLLLLLSLSVQGFQQAPAAFGARRLLTSRFVASPAQRPSCTEQQPPSFEARRTYYDILGSSPNATRLELKRQYVALARVTHPDALIGSNGTDRFLQDDFTAIAQAWRVLSNDKERLRYDRKIFAEDFTESVGMVASEIGKVTGPQFKKVVDGFAVPFIRRTTVTTVASVSAVVDQWNNNKNGTSDFGSAVVSGFKAGAAAIRVVDGMEYMEKSQELEERAQQEAKKAVRTKTLLLEIIDKRLSRSLKTPNSALSSSEALQLLDSLNTIDHVPLLERTFGNRQTLEQEISELESIESEYYLKMVESAESDDQFRVTQVALTQAAREKKQALAAEVAAKKILQAASLRVSQTSQNADMLKKKFTKLERENKKVTAGLEQAAASLMARQERVRLVLLKKEEELALERQEEAMKEYGSHLEEEADTDFSSEYDDGCIEEIEALRKEERLLTLEASRREEAVARLVSRATKLKSRAEFMEKNKKNQMKP